MESSKRWFEMATTGLSLPWLSAKATAAAVLVPLLALALAGCWPGLSSALSAQSTARLMASSFFLFLVLAVGGDWAVGGLQRWRRARAAAKAPPYHTDPKYQGAHKTATDRAQLSLLEATEEAARLKREEQAQAALTAAQELKAAKEKRLQAEITAREAMQRRQERQAEEAKRMQEEARARRELRVEQDAEYLESLRQDRLRAAAEAEEAKRNKEKAAALKAGEALETRQRKRREAQENADARENAGHEEARARSLLRLEQDAEYQEALRMDRDRLEEKQREQEAKAMKQQERKRRLAELRQILPAQPPPTESDVTQIRVRLPNSSTLCRTFSTTDDVSVLYLWMKAAEAVPVDTECYSLVVPFPREELVKEGKTLEQLGLTPQVSLILVVD